MAVMQNSIIFGGIDSADFGIYIGGEGTFDAPKRDVEMISIPGRNGAFALDKGRFENIEVTYSAFNHEPDLGTFSAQLEGFRNAICSQKGYQRLTDTFHPDEYRMAAYIDGLEIKPIEYNTAATFDIKFDCKPQRFLTSGEDAIDISSGDTILNPTLFESSPMLEVEGYGTIGFNGYEIELENVTFGEITIAPRGTYKFVNSYETQINFVAEQFNAGDEILVQGATLVVEHVSGNAYVDGSFKTVYLTNLQVLSDSLSGAQTSAILTRESYSDKTYTLQTALPDLTFTVGTPQTYTNNTLLGGTIIVSGETRTFSENWLFFSVIYDGAGSIVLRFGQGALHGEKICIGFMQTFWSHVDILQIIGDSSVLMLGHPTYIDCDLGEVYMIKDGAPISLNQYVDLGSDLPKLAVGSNEITFDNTITDLKILPRWWKV